MFAGTSTRTPTNSNGTTIRSYPAPVASCSVPGIAVGGARGRCPLARRTRRAARPANTRRAARTRRRSRSERVRRTTVEVLADGRAHQRVAQLVAEAVELFELLHRLGPRLRVALAERRQDQLLVQTDLALDGGSPRPEVTGVDAGAQESAGRGGDLDRFVTEEVGRALAALHDAVLLERLELGECDPGHRRQFLAVDDDAREQPRRRRDGWARRLADGRGIDAGVGASCSAAGGRPVRCRRCPGHAPNETGWIVPAAGCLATVAAGGSSS